MEGKFTSPQVEFINDFWLENPYYPGDRAHIANHNFQWEPLSFIDTIMDREESKIRPQQTPYNPNFPPGRFTQSTPRPLIPEIVQQPVISSR